jgi:hypothetical protein
MNNLPENAREGNTYPSDIVELYKAYEKASDEEFEVRLSFGREGPCSNPQCYKWIELKFKEEEALRRYYEGLLHTSINTLHCLLQGTRDWSDVFDGLQKAISKLEASI